MQRVRALRGRIAARSGDLETATDDVAKLADDPGLAGAVLATIKTRRGDFQGASELYTTIAKVLGKRRRLAHVPIPLARAGAQLTQWAPGAPLTTDQISMIEAGDNVATTTDAVDTFQLPLVALDEQIRRAV